MESGSAARGFTLIELMIAVLIVGILSAIAVPAYQNYLTENKETTAISDIKVIELRIKAFTLENGDVPPPWRLACQFIVRNEDIVVKF